MSEQSTPTKFEDLAKSIVAGNSQAEHELFEYFGSKIDLMVQVRLGKQNEEIRDLSSDIKVVVLISLRNGKFDPARGTPLSAWIASVVRNQVYKYLRDNPHPKTEISLDAIPEPIAENNEKSHLRTEYLHEKMEQEINNLKPEYRQILYYRYFENLPTREISKKLNVPAQKVSERLNYAKKLLKKAVSGATHGKF